MKICGIYIIECILPGKWLGAKYIGQSIDILDRNKNHFYELKGNRKDLINVNSLTQMDIHMNVKIYQNLPERIIYNKHY